MITLSASSPMIPAATLSEQADLVRRWGYDTIAVFQPLADWNDDVRSELASLERRTGVRPVEFVLTDAIYGNAMSADPDLRAACRRMYGEAAAVAAELGLITEIEYEYRPQDPAPLFDPYQQPSAAGLADFTDFYRSLLDVVAGTAGRVLLEPLNRYESRYLNSVADNLDVVEAVAHPNAGLLPDTFHMAIEEADPAASLITAGDRVVHVHLGDSNRLLPGHGRLDWASIFGALREIGYNGAVNLECSTEGDPARSLPATAAFLRSHIES